MTETFVDRCVDLKAMESSVKNRFKWAWLEVQDVNGDFLSDYVRKVPEPGVCFCLICNRRLFYGPRGRSMITRHAMSASHKTKRMLFQVNHQFSAALENRSTRPYGAAPNIPEVYNFPARIDTKEKCKVPLPQMVVVNEAFQDSEVLESQDSEVLESNDTNSSNVKQESDEQCAQCSPLVIKTEDHSLENGLSSQTCSEALGMLRSKNESNLIHDSDQTTHHKESLPDGFASSQTDSLVSDDCSHIKVENDADDIFESSKSYPIDSEKAPNQETSSDCFIMKVEKTEEIDDPFSSACPTTTSEDGMFSEFLASKQENLQDCVSTNEASGCEGTEIGDTDTAFLEKEMTDGMEIERWSGSDRHIEEMFVKPKSDLHAIERSVKNKFRWFWLDDTDCHGDLVSDYLRKLDVPGIAFCLICSSRLSYGSRGKSLISRHVQSRQHILMRNEKKSMKSLQTTLQVIRDLTKGDSSAGSSFTCDEAPNVTMSEANCEVPLTPARSNNLKKSTNLKDRISHQEAIICSFIAEHSLPLSIAPHLVGLAQLLAQDEKALQSMDCNAAHKLKHGLKEWQRKKIVRKMQHNYFSLNLDNSTDKDGKKHVLNILVCLLDNELEKSVTYLYSSVEMCTVDTETLYSAVRDSLMNDNIPFQNLISVLSDSSAYLKCHLDEFYVKMQDEAPHLINIDSNVCHHIHTVSKLFLSSIDSENHVSCLLDDISKDFELADLRHAFSSLCNFLSAECVLPLRRTGHMWLNFFDCCQRLKDLKDVLNVFYFSWLSQSNKDLYQFKVLNILKDKNVGIDNRHKIFELMKKLRMKNTTRLGRMRRLRVCKRLFEFELNTDLIIDAILSVFPVFKEFVSLFEQKTSMVHVLHDNQMSIFKRFLQRYVKPEFLREYARDLFNLDLTRENIYLPCEHIFVGDCSKTFKKMEDADVVLFTKTLLEAYEKTGLYMQKNLALNNPLLRTLSFLDPKAFGNSSTLIGLKKLPQFFPSLPVDDFENEITQMQSDTAISPGDFQLDKWWSNVFRFNRYPCVKRIVSACLCIFTGPRIEQSFSIHKNIFGATFSLSTSTYEDYLLPKYYLLANNSTTLQFYRRRYPITSPVDASLACYFQTAPARCCKIKKRKVCPTLDGPRAKRLH